MMSKWHRSVGVRAALVTGTFALTVAIAAPFVTKFTSSFRSTGHVRLIQFTINSTDSFFEVMKSDPGPSLAEFGRSEAGESANRQLLDRRERTRATREKGILDKLDPVFDVSFFNDGGGDAVLTGLRIKTYAADYMYGDSAERPTAKALPVATRYRILLEPISTFEALEGFHLTADVVAKLPAVDFPLVPPVQIPRNTAARIQLQLQSPNGLIAWYLMDIEFLFANARSVKTDRFRLAL